MQPVSPGATSLCGIFGCVLHDGKEAAPLIHAALKRLEYRGYDSVGEVTISDGTLKVKKDSGRLDEVHAKYNLDLLPGPVGVGHTRWATHGRPVKENSHPLVDCKSRIAVVHNGIIENYLDLKRELEYKAKNGVEVKRDPITITWDPESAKKQGFPHFMLKEIHEQVHTIRDAMGTAEIYFDLLASKLMDAEKVFIVACGTSYHAGLVGAQALMKLAGMNVRVVVASEFSDEALDLVDSKTAILAVSQSGETMDPLNAVNSAKRKGASIVSVTNVLGSTLMRLSDVYIGQNAGPEIGVASTKAFTSQVTFLLRLAIAIVRKKGEVSSKEISELEDAIHRTPAIIQNLLTTAVENVKKIAESCSGASRLCFLGR